MSSPPRPSVGLGTLDDRTTAIETVLNEDPVFFANVRADTVETVKLVSDDVRTSNGRPFLALSENQTGTGRIDPTTVPFSGETFQGMVVDGNLVQFNGTMSGDGKFITSFAEKENESLERRLSEFSKFSDRRVFVSALDGNDSNHGRSWDRAVKTIKRACEIAEPRTTVFVASGDYYEEIPIFVKPNVAIIGDSLRTVFLYSKSWQFKQTDADGKGEYAVPVNGIDYNRRDYFHLSSNTYLVGLRFKYLESPGYCASFPAAMVDVAVENGEIKPPETVPFDWDPDYLPVVYSPDGYFVDNLPNTGPYAAWTERETVSVRFPETAKTNVPMEGAADRLLANGTQIQTQVLAFVDQEMATTSFSLTSNQRERCERDVGYLVDALAHDLKRGTTYHAFESIVRYFDGTERVIETDQIETTARAIERIGVEAESVLATDFLDAVPKTLALVQTMAETLRAPAFETNMDEFFQVVLERVHIVQGGSGYSLDTRVDIAPPAAPGGTRAFALSEIVNSDGSLERIRLFQRGSGYVEEYRTPSSSKETLITVSDDGQGAIVRPVFRIDSFRAWSREGNEQRPAGFLFATSASEPYRSKRAYKSLNGTYDANELYPDDEPPYIALECGLDPRVANFSETAIANPGNFRETSFFLSANRRAIQNHTIETVRTTFPNVYNDVRLRELCFRDVGFLVDAVVSDLFEGGMYESVRAANTYYSRGGDGTFDLILPEAQRTPTANAIREAATYVTNTVLENWDPAHEDGHKAKEIVQALFDGIANTIDNGLLDQEADTIELNTRRYVAYKLHDSNLVKWRFEGRNVRDDGWTVLDARDFTFESRDAINRTVTPTFSAAARENPGGFVEAAATLIEERQNIQDAVIEHVRTEIRPDLSSRQLDLCKRDVGLIVLALARDLRVGGFRNSARSAVAYYLGNRSVLPVEQTQPTVDALVFLRNQASNVVDASIVGIVNGLVNGIVETIQNPRISVEGRYGIASPRGFHYYRLVMLQNDEDLVGDSGTMKVGRIELFEEAIPDVVVDGPAITETIVDFVELTERGSGYDPNDPPTVSFLPVNVNDPPQVQATGVAVVSTAGRVERVSITNPGRGYNAPPEVVVDPPASGGTQATGFVLMGDDYARVRVERLDPETGRIDQVRIVSPGSGYAEVPTVSIHAPERLRPVVVASPYVQNCSNISGPWDQRRRRVLEFYPLPFPLEDVYRDGPNALDRRRINTIGSAGGIRIDGACPRVQSPLRSFVVDAFTQVNQGGIGFLLVNRAYAQFVSTFGTFCETHMKALGGSFANASNSVTDFGVVGLEARGYWPFPYARARVVPPGPEPWIAGQSTTSWSSARGMYLSGPQAGYYSDVVTFTYESRGSGYTPASEIRIRVGAPTVSGGTRARVDGTPADDNFITIDTSEFSETGQALDDLLLFNQTNLVTEYNQSERPFRGTGYKSAPDVIVESSGPGEGAQLSTTLSGVSVVRIQVLEGRRPEILSIARVHGRWHTIESVREAFDAQDREIPGQYDITVSPPANYAETGFEILFHNVSYLSTGSHVMEYVGSGITYNALPEFGGVPSVSAEIRAQDPAKVFFTTSDHRGNSRVGPQFAVDQATGSIAIEASELDLSNINSIGPFVRNGITVGERLREVSNNAQLRSDATGTADGETVPTQAAVKTYVDRRTVPGVPEDFRVKRYFLRADQEGTQVPGQQFIQRYKWRELGAEDLRIEESSLRTDVLTGLFVDGNTNIYQTAAIGSVQITNPEADPPLPNGALSIRVDASNGAYKVVFTLSDPSGSGTTFSGEVGLSSSE